MLLSYWPAYLPFWMNLGLQKITKMCLAIVPVVMKRLGVCSRNFPLRPLEGICAHVLETGIFWRIEMKFNIDNV